MSKLLRPRWRGLCGYHKLVDANIPAASAYPGVDLFNEIPSNTLITRITHLGTFVGTGAAIGFVMWSLRRQKGDIYPYNAIKDLMGYGGQPLKLVDVPEIYPGQYFSVAGQNSDGANAYQIGVVILGEQGIWEYDNE